MTNFLKQTTRNQIALTIHNTTCQDLKTFDFGHTKFFTDLKYFIKSDYAKYLKQDKEEHKHNENSLKEVINFYWYKFQLGIRPLNLT